MKEIDHISLLHVHPRNIPVYIPIILLFLSNNVSSTGNTCEMATLVLRKTSASLVKYHQYPV